MPKKGNVPEDYPSILKAPFPRSTLLNPLSDEDVERLIDERMKTLLDYYGLDREAAFDPTSGQHSTEWANLALALAREFVPGFQGEPAGRGRPATLNSDITTLVLTVLLYRYRDGVSERAAIEKIAGEGQFGTTNPAALRKRLADRKAVYAPLMNLLRSLESQIPARREAVVKALANALE